MTIDLKSGSTTSYVTKEEILSCDQDEKTGIVAGTAVITLHHKGPINVGDNLLHRKYTTCNVVTVIDNRDTKGVFLDPQKAIKSFWVLEIVFAYTMPLSKIKPIKKEKKGWYSPQQK